MQEEQSQRANISFVVPCYNESGNLAAAVGQIEAAARDAAVPAYEILIVDDCSTDTTGKVAADLVARDSRIRLVTNPRNLGFGGAYKEGVKNATGSFVIMVPGDNAHPHEGISPILREAGEADIVVPYVKNPEARFWGRRVVSRAFTGLMNFLFGLDLPYFNGLVLHKTDLLKTIEIRTNGFAYQAEAQVKLINAGATYTTVAVEITERNGGRTSAFRPMNICRVIRAVMRLWLDVRRSSGAALKPSGPKERAATSEGSGT